MTPPLPSLRPPATFPTRRTSATRCGPASVISSRRASGWPPASSYGSGLPFAYTGDEADALAQYGPEVISRINFVRGRILPLLAIDATLGADIYKSERMTMRFQADGSNLNSRLNVIDFGGLFSGNAIAPGRSFALRLTTNF